MQNNRLKVEINKPISEVFEFTLNPKNTPKWIDFIEVEETNEWPVKLGTIYRNSGKNSNWSEYELTDFKQNETFTLTKKNNPYRVKYTFKPLDNNKTELEYYEWVEEGDMEPFKQGALNKLKAIMED